MCQNVAPDPNYLCETLGIYYIKELEFLEKYAQIIYGKGVYKKVVDIIHVGLILGIC